MFGVQTAAGIEGFCAGRNAADPVLESASLAVDRLAATRTGAPSSDNHRQRYRELVK
jgi:hypothetical protein